MSGEGQKHEPEEYIHVKTWCEMQGFGHEAEKYQNRASEEGQPLDAFAPRYMSKRWWRLKDLLARQRRELEERAK